MSSLPPTEAAHEASGDLDLLTTPELVELLAVEQRHAVAAVAAQTIPIARAVGRIAARMSGGGTLNYVGAGSSGRIAVLDAAEMPPTFGTPPELVRAHMLELAGNRTGAAAAYRAAARLTTSLPERRYLEARAAGM